MHKITMDDRYIEILEDTYKNMYLIEFFESDIEEHENKIMKQVNIKIIEVPLEEVFLKLKFDKYQLEIFDMFIEE